MNLADGLKWMVEHPMVEVICLYRNYGGVRNRYNPGRANFEVLEQGEWRKAQIYSADERIELIPPSVLTLEERVRKLEQLHLL